MKLLIDANILLDVLQMRQPYYRDSAIIWKLCETEQIKGCVSALTFANLVYVMRKELDSKTIRSTLQTMSLIFELTDLEASDIVHASEMEWGDFEDAVQSATAERIRANYIIKRNVRDFTKSKVMALTPGELIARI